jgi:hypothetical protein
MPDYEWREFDTDDEAKEHAINITRDPARDAANGSLRDLELVMRDEIGERFVSR